MLNICRLWTTRHFPISAAGRALDHQSIHPLTSTGFSLDHPFHKELYDHIKEQASCRELIKMGSLHVSIPEPDPDDAKIVEVIQAEFQKIGEQDESPNGNKD